MSQTAFCSCDFRVRHNLPLIWHWQNECIQQIESESGAGIHCWPLSGGHWQSGCIKTRQQDSVLDLQWTPDRVHRLGSIEIHPLWEKKTASSFTHVACSSIPPTSAATAYHAQRAYYQVQVWLFSNGNLNPTDWGWKNVNEKLSPIHTDLSPAPADVLRVIRCGCKGDCSSIKCSCKSHGLDCSSACKECKGTSCLNAGNYTSDSAE